MLSDSDGSTLTCDHPLRKIKEEEVEKGVGRGYSSDFLEGVCGSAFQTQTLFNTKICNFQYDLAWIHTSFCKIHTRFLTKTAHKLYLLVPHTSI